MRTISRFFEYFSTLHERMGVWEAIIFILTYVSYRVVPPKRGALAKIQVGKHVFYFPSVHEFIGLFKEVFLSESYYLAPTNDPITVVDCGANIGVALLYIKERAPHARVTCFEPNPAARAVLEKNIAANRWEEDVRVYPYALGNMSGTAEFFVDERMPSGGGGSLTEKHLSTKKVRTVSYPVEVRRLSECLTEKIDFLKIDTEGAEFDILEDILSSGQAANIRRVQLEYHYSPGYFPRPLSALLALLESAGFKTFAEATVPPYVVLDRDTRHHYMVFGWRA